MRTIDNVRAVTIEKVAQISSNIRSFYFHDNPSLASQPGQFAMVWLPGVGEFPMSLALPLKGLASIGVKAMGVGTRVLYECKAGEKLGMRGPYGTFFDLNRSSSYRKRRRFLLSGGGTGLVPMLVLANELSKVRYAESSVVVSARTKSELPFLKSFQRIVGKDNVYPTTDDGSYGFRGLGHERVAELVENSSKKTGFDEIFSCGPERMMAEIYKIARKYSIPVQFSLERIMKCGIGICGSCTIGDLVLCIDGPVLDEKQLASIGSEFGQFHRDKTGTICPI